MNRKPVDALITNKKGVDLIKGFEQLRTRSYYDQAGVITIGYGHTGPDVYPGQTISPQRAEELFREDLEKREVSLRAMVGVPLTENEFSALVSWLYNVGSGNARSSTLIQILNQGASPEDVANQLLRWNKVRDPKTGKLIVSNGLVRRRKAEHDLYLDHGQKKKFS